MRKLLVATRNKGKLPEIVAELAGAPFEVVSLNDVPEIPTDFEAEENGTTFEENAVIKAKTYGKKSGLMTLADDSGLCVDALDGRPGVFSARYGETPELRNNKLLEELAGVPKENRTARYICVVAVYDPDTNKVFTGEGKCEGVITERPLGANGFGYDPVFYSTDLCKTAAEATKEEKNSISHRGRAMREIKKILMNSH